MTEVFIAAAVSSLLTFILAGVFCFCSRQKQQLKNKTNEKPAKPQRQTSAASVKDENDNLEVVINEKALKDNNLEPPGSPGRSISNSMATTFEPELQSIMTEKETEEIHRDSKFRERYTTQIPKVSSNTQSEIHSESKTRFWKSCLSNSEKKETSQKIPIEEISPKKLNSTKKFEETQEYLRRPNALYPPWHTSGPPPEHYHTLPNPHHFHHVHHVPHHTHSAYDHYGPGSYHTIAHYQLYKRPMHHICPNAAPAPPPPPVPPNHPSGIVMDFHRGASQHEYAQTLGRRKEMKKESELMRHPVKLKKLIKSKMLMHQHHHHSHPVHMHEDHMKMYTWSPYSSHVIYNEPIAGKSLDELRF